MGEFSLETAKILFTAEKAAESAEFKKLFTILVMPFLSITTLKLINNQDQE